MALPRSLLDRPAGVLGSAVQGNTTCRRLPKIQQASRPSPTHRFRCPRRRARHHGRPMKPCRRRASAGAGGGGDCRARWRPALRPRTARVRRRRRRAIPSGDRAGGDGPAARPTRRVGQRQRRAPNRPCRPAKAATSTPPIPPSRCPPVPRRRRPPAPAPCRCRPGAGAGSRRGRPPPHRQPRSNRRSCGRAAPMPWPRREGGRRPAATCAVARACAERHPVRPRAARHRAPRQRRGTLDRGGRFAATPPDRRRPHLLPIAAGAGATTASGRRAPGRATTTAATGAPGSAAPADPADHGTGAAARRRRSARNKSSMSLEFGCRSRLRRPGRGRRGYTRPAHSLDDRQALGRRPEERPVDVRHLCPATRRRRHRIPLSRHRPRGREQDHRPSRKADPVEGRARGSAQTVTGKPRCGGAGGLGSGRAAARASAGLRAARPHGLRAHRHRRRHARRGAWLDEHDIGKLPDIEPFHIAAYIKALTPPRFTTAQGSRLPSAGPCAGREEMKKRHDRMARIAPNGSFETTPSNGRVGWTAGLRRNRQPTARSRRNRSLTRTTNCPSSADASVCAAAPVRNFRSGAYIIPALRSGRPSFRPSCEA